MSCLQFLRALHASQQLVQIQQSHSKEWQARHARFAYMLLMQAQSPAQREPVQHQKVSAANVPRAPLVCVDLTKDSDEEDVVQAVSPEEELPARNVRKRGRVEGADKDVSRVHCRHTLHAHTQGCHT